MKKNIFKVSFIAAALLAFGCDKINPVEPEVKLDSTPLTVIATANAETKTSIDLTGENQPTKPADYGKVTWNENDRFVAVVVHNEATVGTINFKLKSGAGEATATFESDGDHAAVEAGDKIYAFYGCTINSNNKPVWPTEQLASTTGTITSTDDDTVTGDISGVPMVALASATDAHTISGFAFQNAGGILTLNVLNNTGSPINPTWLYVNNVKAGEFNLPVFNSEGALQSIEFTSKATTQIKWLYNSETTLNNNVRATVRVAVPAGTYDNLQLIFEGNFGNIPYGYVRDLAGKGIAVHRNKLDQINLNLYKAIPIDVNDLAHTTIGTVGDIEGFDDPHHQGPRQGIVAGFDLTSGQALDRLVIATSNMVLNGKKEDDGEEHPWNPGTLMTYNETNKHTAGGHWRLMTKEEAEKVIQTDESGSGIAMWGQMKGLIKGVETTTEGIYWYFDPVRYKQQYGADVLPNSIFLPVTHHDDYHNRMEGRYWLNQDYCFEFYKDPLNPTRGIVEVKLASEIQGTDNRGALRLVHTIDPVQSLATSLSVNPTDKVYMETMAETTVVANVTFSAASAENVVWSTSNSDIARVINVIRQDVSATEAKFTATIESDANNLGDVTITAKIGGLTKTIDIKVVPAWNY